MNIENCSLEMAEEMCANRHGYRLLSINSHEEQQLMKHFFHKLENVYRVNTIYLFISLKKQVHVHYIARCINVAIYSNIYYINSTEHLSDIY